MLRKIQQCPPRCPRRPTEAVTAGRAIGILWVASTGQLSALTARTAPEAEARGQRSRTRENLYQSEVKFEKFQNVYLLTLQISLISVHHRYSRVGGRSFAPHFEYFEFLKQQTYFIKSSSFLAKHSTTGVSGMSPPDETQKPKSRVTVGVARHATISHGCNRQAKA